PAGLPDPSVFSTDYNREGIRVGTAVSVIVHREVRAASPPIPFRHFWGANKRSELLESVSAQDFNAAYTPATPTTDNRLSFRPENVSATFRSWACLNQLSEVAPLNGLMEKRGGSLIDIDRDVLAQWMRDYFDPNLTWDD